MLAAKRYLSTLDSLGFHKKNIWASEANRIDVLNMRLRSLPVLPAQALFCMRRSQ